MSFTFTLPKYRYFKNRTGNRYYKYVNWTQPVLTSNTSSNLMQIEVSSAYPSNTDYSGWRSFESNQEDSICWCADPSDTSAFMIIKFSEPLYLRSIDVKNRETVYSFLQDYILQGSNDSGATWETIYSGSCPNFEAYGEWNLFKSSGQNPKYAWLKILAVSNYGEGYTVIGNIFIDVNLAGSTAYTIASSNSYDFTETYTYEEEVSSLDDYDYIEITSQSYSVIKEVEKYYKNVTRYYKYLEQPWVQPVLKSNGVLGVSDFAVRASSELDSIRQAYRAFDGSNANTEVDCWHSVSSANEWIEWFTKSPTKINKITVFNRGSHEGSSSSVNPIGSWELQVSNDGATWRTLKNGTNSNTAPYGSWEIAVDSSVQTFSNYWKLKIINNSNGNYVCIGELKIDALAKNSYEVSSDEAYDFSLTSVMESDKDDYDFFETVDKRFKVEWKNPILFGIKINAPDLLRGKVVKVNGVDHTTDSNGALFVKGNYGERKSFYIQYGYWSKAVTLSVGAKEVKATLNPDFQEVIISKPDKTVVANQIITLDGVEHKTDANGKIVLFGEYTSSKSIYFYLNGNYYVTSTITYSGGVTNIVLEEHIIAGSIDASVWNYSASSWAKRGLTFTAPTAVRVMKLTGSGFDGWSDEASDPAYVGTSSSSGASGGTAIFYGTGSFTKYLGVTPGKTYTLYGRWISGGSLSYSDDINKQSVNVNLG